MFRLRIMLINLYPPEVGGKPHQVLKKQLRVIKSRGEIWTLPSFRLSSQSKTTIINLSYLITYTRSPSVWLQSRRVNGHEQNVTLVTFYCTSSCTAIKRDSNFFTFSKESQNAWIKILLQHAEFKQGKRPLVPFLLMHILNAYFKF